MDNIHLSYQCNFMSPLHTARGGVVSGSKKRSLRLWDKFSWTPFITVDVFLECLLWEIKTGHNILTLNAP